MSAVCAQRLAAAESLWSITTRLGSFGTSLGLKLQRDGGRLTPVRIDSATSEWKMPWPTWAARSDGKVCLAVVLALADEISSYGGMACFDKKRRPGVTLSISGTLAARSNGEVPCVSGGEELHFVSRKLKTGRQLGHMELEIWRGAPSSSGQLLAVGRHSKMLSLPAPLLSPISVLEAVGASAMFAHVQPWAMRLFEHRYPDVRPWPPMDPKRRVDLFPPLEAIATYAESHLMPLRPPAVTSSGGYVLRPLRPPAAVEGTAPILYAAPLSPTWSNLMGNMHGGAACILGEQIAAASYRRAMGADLGADVSPPPRMMHVQMLSGLVCDGRMAQFEAVSSPAPGQDHTSRSTLATMRHATNAGRAVECMYWW